MARSNQGGSGDGAIGGISALLLQSLHPLAVAAVARHSAYREDPWTRPWRPQTNGKVERFHRTLLEEWACQQPYESDRQRQQAFTDWIDWYNYHRPHTGIAGQTPASRVTNLSEQHT